MTIMNRAPKAPPAAGVKHVRARPVPEREPGQLPEVPTNGPAPPKVADHAKDPRPKTDLMDSRYQYRYDVKNYEGVGMAAWLMPAEYFSLTYVYERVLASKRALATMLVNFVLERARKQDEHKDLGDYTDYFAPFWVKIFGIIPIALGWLFPQDAFVQLPEVEGTWMTDEAFAEQRLSGLCPVMIRALKADDPRKAVLDGAKGLPANVQDLCAKGKVFLCDFTGSTNTPSGKPDWNIPESIIGGPDGKDKRHLPRPIAFFYWSDAAARLMPLAIKLDTGSHIYTPADPKWNWTFAKMCVQTADSNHHELTVHLGRCHLAMEPFAISTRRTLDEGHPLNLLLAPHTRFMISNNELGRRTLVAPGGALDVLLCGTLEENNEITRRGIVDLDLQAVGLPRDIADRGVGSDVVPRYAYRDDGILLHGALNKYVTDYIETAYPTEAAIKDDKELQAWAADLAEHGRVATMPAHIESRAQLIELLTNVLYIFTALHCAVNYSQDVIGGYVPNVPLMARASYRDLAARGESNPITEKELVRFMPARATARNQLQTLLILCAYRFDQLGHYDKAFQSLFNMSSSEVFHYFGRGDLQDCVNRFEDDLAEVTRKVDANHKERLAFGINYPFLRPDKVLNSVSI